MNSPLGEPKLPQSQTLQRDISSQQRPPAFPHQRRTRVRPFVGIIVCLSTILAVGVWYVVRTSTIDGARQHSELAAEQAFRRLEANDANALIEVLTQWKQSVDSYGSTALFFATEETSVKKLLDAGVNARSVNRWGCTALHFAAARAQPEACRMLIDAGADVNAADAYGETPVFWLLNGQGSTEFGYVNNTVPAEKDQSLVLSMLVSKGADLNRKDCWGHTPIFKVSGHQSQNVGLLMDAIRLGADVNHRDSTGFTPMHVAAFANYARAIESLLVTGADPNIGDANEGRTPLHIAAANSDPESIRLLLKYGANPDAKNSVGVTPRAILARTSLSGLLADHSKGTGVNSGK